jgi:hypothetical protein
MRNMFIGFTVQSAALHMIFTIRTESKIQGLSEREKNRYVKRLGFKNYAEYKRFRAGDVETMLKVSPKVLMAMYAYSPTHGSLFTLADLVAGLAHVSIGGGRYKPVEEVLVSVPSLSYPENMLRGIIGMADGEVTQSDLRRIKSLMIMNSHPIMQYGFNKMITATDLKER